MDTTYTQILNQAGLEANQASIYEVLLKNGPLPAGKIHQKSPLKRGLVYKVLQELEVLGLVIKKDEPGKVAIFEPGHPLKLKELAEEKEKQAKTAQLALEGAIPQLVSEFNLSSGKPGVRFFEGHEGLRQVLADSLTAKTEICSYADLETIAKYLDKENREYVAKRERLKIQRRGFVVDTPYARDYMKLYNPTMTNIKFIRHTTAPFQTLMNIYDNKIAYLTLNPDRLIGLIVEQESIYLMHRYLFEHLWALTPATYAAAANSETSAAGTSNT